MVKKKAAKRARCRVKWETQVSSPKFPSKPWKRHAISELLVDIGIFMGNVCYSNISCHTHSSQKMECLVALGCGQKTNWPETSRNAQNCKGSFLPKWHETSRRTKNKCKDQNATFFQHESCLKLWAKNAIQNGRGAGGSSGTGDTESFWAQGCTVMLRSHARIWKWAVLYRDGCWILLAWEGGAFVHNDNNDDIAASLPGNTLRFASPNTHGQRNSQRRELKAGSCCKKIHPEHPRTSQLGWTHSDWRGTTTLTTFMSGPTLMSGP